MNLPLCLCGCGQFVSSPKKRFVHGHHIRMPGKHPRKKGSIPWNKGNVTRYDYVCAECHKPFQSKLKEAKFCSRACYAQGNAGTKSIFWKGGALYSGGARTKYRFTAANGKIVRIHRAIMEAHVGRPLHRTERVHHIDGNGENNAISNLHLFHCEACHQHHHRQGNPLVYLYGEVHSG